MRRWSRLASGPSFRSTGFGPASGSPLTQAQIAWHLAWKPQLLDFSEATLPVIVAEFNRRNPVQIEIPDEALRQRRLSAVIRSDNVTGFIARLEADFGIRAERRPDGGIVLTAR